MAMGIAVSLGMREENIVSHTNLTLVAIPGTA
jgi:hypothetical protein